MKCGEVIEKLEKMSPLSFGEKWDNTGFLCGSREKEIKTVSLAVDATDGVVEDAIRRGADLLLTHHPLIFKPLKRIVQEDFIGRRVLSLIRHEIGCYAIHTNFDVMGMADAAADRLGLSSRRVLEVTYEKDTIREGLGRIGRLPRSMTLEECGEAVKQAFDLETVRVFGQRNQKVEWAAISPGSISRMLEAGIKEAADVLITGDIGHHDGVDGLAQGMALIDAGHFGLEKLFVPYLREFFKREMPEITVLEAKEENPCFFM